MIMKKCFIFALYSSLSLVAAAQTTVAVSGNLKNMFGAASATRMQACFSLILSDGQSPADPHVAGVGIIAPIRHQCVSPAADGSFSVSMYPGDVITTQGVANTTLYAVAYEYNGSFVSGATYQFLLADVTENLNTKTPVNVSPSIVPAPSDSIYMRIDAGNSPATDSWQFNANLTVLGKAILASTSISKLSRDCRQDGVVADGTVEDGAAVNNCIVNAIAANQAIAQLPCGPIKISTSINLTNRPGFTLQGCGTYGTNDNTVVGNITFIKCNTGNACIDTVGSGNTTIRNMTLRIANTYATPSTIGILEGRDNALGGGNGRFCFAELDRFEKLTIWTDHNMGINAGRGYIGVYNIAAEHQRYGSMKVFADTDFFFATSNVLGLASAYQTLQTGCPGSMTIVNFDDVSMTVNGGSGIEAWTTAGFRFGNAVEIDFTTNDTAFQAGIATNGTYMIGWSGYVHVENMIATDSFLTLGATTVDKNELTAFIGGSTGSGSYVSFAGTGQTITDNIFKVNTQNEGAGVRQFVGNSANTIKGGELWIGTTANPQTAASITLTGVKVYAQGFADAQVTFNSASDYMLQSDTGTSRVTSIGRAKMPYLVRLASDFTDANSAGLQAITGLSFSLPSVAANYSYHCAVQYTQATPSANDQFGVASLTTAPTNLTMEGLVAQSGAVAVYASATITNTTPTASVTFTPASAAILGAHFEGTIEAAGGGASTLQFYILNGTDADVITIKKDSYCVLFPY